MRKIISNNKITIFFILLSPILIAFGGRLIPFSDKIPGDDGDWIGFWASYLGTIVAILIAAWVAKYESDVNKEEIDNLSKKQDKVAESLVTLSDNQLNLIQALNDFENSYSVSFDEKKQIERSLLINERLLQMLFKSEESIDCCLKSLTIYRNANAKMFNFVDDMMYGGNKRNSQIEDVIQSSTAQYILDINRSQYNLRSVLSLLDMNNIDTSDLEAQVKYLDKIYDDIEKFPSYFNSLITQVKSDSQKLFVNVINERANALVDQNTDTTSENEQLLMSLKNLIGDLINSNLKLLPYKHHQ